MGEIVRECLKAQHQGQRVAVEPEILKHGAEAQDMGCQTTARQPHALHRTPVRHMPEYLLFHSGSPRAAFGASASILRPALPCRSQTARRYHARLVDLPPHVARNGRAPRFALTLAP